MGGRGRLDISVPEHLELVQLREPLRSGFSLPVTVEFRDAGAVTLRVPIRTYEGVRPDRLVEHSS